MASKEIYIKTNNTWIIVCCNEKRNDPNTATPLCLVVTKDNNEEYELSCHLQKINMNGYSLKYAQCFGGEKKLKETYQSLSVNKFIDKYKQTITSIEGK